MSGRQSFVTPWEVLVMAVQKRVTASCDHNYLEHEYTTSADQVKGSSDPTEISGGLQSLRPASPT